MAADGSIIIETDIDDKKAQTELNRLNRKIQSLNEKIYTKKQMQMPLVEESKRLGAELDAAKAKLDQMQSGTEFNTTAAAKEQQQRVNELQKEWNRVEGEVERYEKSIKEANISLDLTKQQAGEIERHMAQAVPQSERMSEAMRKMRKNADRFSMRFREVLRSALLFTVISQGLSSFRKWLWKVIRTNDDAVSAIAKLKGAFLTLAQPLVEVIIPAFTTFVNVLTRIVHLVASLLAKVFGSTSKNASEAAEKLDKEANALEGVGAAAEKAAGSLAGFDEINAISSEKSGSVGLGSEGIKPDFSETDGNWLKEVLGSSAEMVTAALLLGGMALIAFGAALGNLPLVLTGLMLLGSGFIVGSETGVLEDWAKRLGLDNVWEFVTAALLLGGMALIVFGASLGNILLVFAGLALLGSGIAVGVESGTFQHWAEKLGLNSVFEYVAIALQLAGIAFIAIGAAMGNIFMVITGALLLTAGLLAETIGEQNLKKFWEKLQLTNVTQWVSVALLLGGICFVAIGAVMGNIIMVIAGLVMLGVGSGLAAGNNNLEDWVKVLGLEKVVGWVTAALLLAGMALIVFGIAMANILMVVAGIGFLYAGYSIGTSSGTLKKWWDALGLDKVSGWVSTAMKLGGIALIALGAATANLALVIAGLGLLGVGVASSAATKRKGTFGSGKGGSFGGKAMPRLSNYHIPALATGAVIPPNREFMAILGDQRSGNNIEAPEALIRKIVREEAGGMNTDLLQAILEAIRAGQVIKVNETVLGRTTAKAINKVTQSAGKAVLLY